jgi:hypothetical protein
LEEQAQYSERSSRFVQFSKALTLCSRRRPRRPAGK